VCAVRPCWAILISRGAFQKKRARCRWLGKRAARARRTAAARFQGAHFMLVMQRHGHPGISAAARHLGGSQAALIAALMKIVMILDLPSIT
jgi:hypothetical protein